MHLGAEETRERGPQFVVFFGQAFRLAILQRVSSAFHGLAAVDAFHHLLHLPNGIALFLNLVEEFHLQFGASQREQGAGVALVHVLVAQRHLHLCRQLEQAQIVGNRGAVLAHLLRKLVLREAVLLDEVLIGEGYFDGVEVFALNVLNERHLHHRFVARRADIGRHGAQARQLRSAPAAFAGNDFVSVVGVLAQRYGLNDADLPNRVGKFLQRSLVELSAGLVRVGLYLVHGHFVDARRAVCVYFFVG